MNTSLFVKNGRKYAPAPVDAVVAEAEAIYRSRTPRGDVMRNPCDTRDYVARIIRHKEHEVFCILFLDNKHRVICFEEMFRGTIDGASVHPREVVKRVLHHNAAAVILAHNHPSGVAEPSRADEGLTIRLKDALALIDVRVLDHIVVGCDHTVSFSERGLC